MGKRVKTTKEELRKEERTMQEIHAGINAIYFVTKYIEEPECYTFTDFCKKYGVDQTTFRAQTERVAKINPPLYEKYLNSVEVKKKARLSVPVAKLSNIIYGIENGVLMNGEKFNILQFYKLLPFQFKNLDIEMKEIIKTHPKLEKLRFYRKYFCDKNLGLKKGSYAENMFLLTLCFNWDGAFKLLDYMKSINFNGLTPIGRASIVNTYLTASEEEFNVEDANYVFDLIEELDLPKCLEVFNILKEQRESVKQRVHK